MREKFQRFMTGRYGNDRFNQFLMILALVCMVFSVFGMSVFFVISAGLIVYAYFRMFSRNTAKRAAENRKFWTYEIKAKNFFKRKRKEFAERKDFRIYKCPNCGQKLRVPKGRGRIAIRCRKCGTEFIRKS